MRIDIDKYKKTYLGGYNYEHFTIQDNLSISDERRLEIESQYDKNSIWYKRDIIGLRCTAEGLIYREFADKPEDYHINIDNIKNNVIIVTVGVDFGGNGSATTFVCTAFTRGLEKVIPCISERHKEELNPEDLNEIFANFISS